MLQTNFSTLIDDQPTPQVIPLYLVEPHPDNPRLKIKQDVVDAIAQCLGEEGYKPKYAIHVRPYNGKYQVISGHNRRLAALQAGLEEIPAWIEEMNDEAAFLELVRANNQGELSPLEVGIHALKSVPLARGGRGHEGGLREYARSVGRTKDSIYRYRKAAIVFLSVQETVASRDSLALDYSRLIAIGKAPEAHWQKLVEMAISQKWSLSQIEKAVEIIEAIDIPEEFHSWLPPDKWTKDAIKDYLKWGDDARTHDNITRWVKSAQEQYDNFSAKRRIFEIDGEGGVTTQTLNLKQLFVDRLAEQKGVPSDKKILAAAQQLLDEVTEKDRLYQQWEKEQASTIEADRQAEARQQELLALVAEYSPVGHNGDLRELDFPSESYDAIITDPPYLLSNDGYTVRSGEQVSVNKNFADNDSAIAPEEWVDLVAKWLKPGGVLVATCSLHILYRLQNACSSAGLVIDRDQAIWYKRNAPPQLSPTQLRADFEYIFLAFKPGAKYYFGYDDYRSCYDSQPSRIFDIPQCSGKERLGEHDTQKPLELYRKLVQLYCPAEGRILEPFAGSGTTVVAAKQLKRHCDWVERDEKFFSLASDRIDKTPFPWEV